MGLKAACGSCGKTYSVGDENAGKRFKCKACGGVIAVPGGAPARKAAAPAVRKICVICGNDVSQSQRTKDTEGNYYCPGCYESAKAEAAAGPSDPFGGDGMDLLDAAAAVATAESSVRTAPPPVNSPPPVPAHTSAPARRTKAAKPTKVLSYGREEKSSYGGGGSLPIGLVILGLLVVSCVLPFIKLELAFIGVIAGAILMFYGGIKMLIIAFAESAFCGLMYLFVPFYGLYYLITRWEQTKEPFGAAIGGWVIVMATAFCANMAKGG